MSLQDIPFDIKVELMKEWSNIEDLRKYNIIAKNKNIPNEHFAIFNMDYFILNHEIKLKSDNLKWLLENNIKVENVEISDFDNQLLFEYISRFGQFIRRIKFNGYYQNHINGPTHNFIFEHCPSVKEIIFQSYPSMHHTDIHIMSQILILISKNCPKLEYLDISLCYGVSDYDIEFAIKNLHNLIHLDISQIWKITNKSILLLSENCLKLKYLDITGTHVKDISPLKNCHDLEYLAIKSIYELNVNSIIPMTEGCHHLKYLDLNFSNHITDSTIMSIASNCHEIEHLSIESCTKITDQSIIEIGKNCHNLTFLNISSINNLTNLSLNSIANGCPRLKYLNISFNQHFTKSAVDFFYQRNPNIEIKSDYCEQIYNKENVNFFERVNAEFEKNSKLFRF